MDKQEQELRELVAFYEKKVKLCEDLLYEAQLMRDNANRKLHEYLFGWKS